MKFWTAVLFVVPLSLQAQLNRSAVSVNGLDTNACTTTSPCRSFAQALTQTNPKGEVIALDSGGFGAVTIDKAVKIVAAPGVYAGIGVTAGVVGVWVIAGPSDVVVLRGLTLIGAGGSNAIYFSLGGRLYVENCVVENIGNAIVSVYGNLVVTDTIIRRIFNAIEVYGGKSLVDHVTISQVSNIAVQAAQDATLSVRNTVVSDVFPGYFGNAFRAGSNTTASLNLENCAAFNIGGGVVVSSGGLIRVSNSVMTANPKGFWILGGLLETYGNNQVRGNGTDIDGTPTAVGQD